MSIYRRDTNGAEKIAVILVDSDGKSVATGTQLGDPGSTFTDANGDQYLLCIPYDEDGVEQ